MKEGEEKNLNDQNEVFRYLVNKNTNYAKLPRSGYPKHLNVTIRTN
ncbi:18305_t:CDS:2 [Entrophospora sp. SA101]|nr:18305_t:CDS:2 [Entrophospora sp. SA101]